VLVAEDHRRLAETVAAGLRAEGMAVDVVFDGQDALDRVALARYDVIVLDGQDHHRAAARQARRPAPHPDRPRRRLPDRHGSVTGPAAWLPVPLRLRLPRPTARLRLTVLYGTLFTLAGTGLLAFTYWLFDRATAGAKILPAGPPCYYVIRHNNSITCEQQIGAALHAHRFDLHALLAQSGTALGVKAVLAFALGWVIAGRVLRPVRVITATARRISATSLHERLALGGPDDEFKELADTLDDLLTRLEASFTAQRHFVASASHELRTPLTLDRTLLQVTLRNPDAATGQWRAVGQELLESGRQQERTLEALLTLAGENRIYCLVNRADDQQQQQQQQQQAPISSHARRQSGYAHRRHRPGSVREPVPGPAHSPLPPGPAGWRGPRATPPWRPNPRRTADQTPPIPRSGPVDAT
jgi:HAMP domain-containing protein